MYKVAEKFISINGEGKKAGELAVFIRLAGCNLDCSYCDTSWAAWDDTPHELMTASDILTYIIETGISNVTLTGGEPLAHGGVEALIDAISKQPHLQLEVETNGSVSIRALKEKYQNVSYTVDYKSMSSGMTGEMCMDNFEAVDMKDTVKFVVGSTEDLLQAYRVMVQYDLTDKTSVYLSPIYDLIEAREIVDFMVNKRLNQARVQLQLHKYIWDPEKKGV